jgi:hypothetical protein
MASSNILILGASYGSLLASKLLFGGHQMTLVCLPAEAEEINRSGIRVRLPVKGLSEPVELDSRQLPGSVKAIGAGEADPAKFDLVGLAMQEPQYRVPEVKALLAAVAKSGVPCMSIMNMPPLTYLERIPGLDTSALHGAYTDASVWNGFRRDRFTLCSPDPQAFRPPDEKPNVLQVTLPTNFKAAAFEDAAATALLRGLQDDVEAARLDTSGGKIELPVKLKVHDSIFVPLAKWSMLLAGNYRCVTESGPRPIQEAVHSNLEESRAVYDWVRDLCVTLGADPADLVPFEKYAAAAKGLSRPSSAARALFAGAPYIERVDRLVQAIAKQKGMQNAAVDRTIALVDAQLEKNRKAAA